MRIATLLVLGIGAALAAPQLAAPPAESHALAGGPPSCPVALALPEELNVLVKARDDEKAPCRAEIVFITTPVTLMEISAQAMGHIWAGTTDSPNARIERADRLLRNAYAKVMVGLESVTGIERAAPQDDVVGEIDRTGLSR